MVFVAVVVTSEVSEGVEETPNFVDLVSNRPGGEWAAFLGRTEDEAANLALESARNWSRSFVEGARMERAASYRVLVGQLTKAADLPAPRLRDLTR